MMYTGGKLFVSLMLISSLLFVLSACAPLPTAVSQEFKPLYYTDRTPVAGTGLALTLTATQYPIAPASPGKDLVFTLEITNTGSVPLIISDSSFLLGRL